MEFFLALFAVIICIEDVSGRICYHTARSDDQPSKLQLVTANDGEEKDFGSGKIEDGVEHCLRDSDHCFALWVDDHSPNSTGISYIGQGCWESSGKQECESNECISKRQPNRAHNNTNFCCCTGNYCNTNVSFVFTESNSEPDPVQEPVEMLPVERLNLALISVLVAVGFLTVSLLLIALRLYHVKRAAGGKPGLESVHLIEHATQFGTAFNPDDLKLEALIGQGRYGSVWRGKVAEMEVAVKVFPPQHRIYFYNERDTYCLPFMNHSSLLTYFGCDERTRADGSAELLLFLSLAPFGSLQGYLRANTLDWTTFCKMALSIAAGLAHLHTDYRKGDKVKPCLSHRDLNSNNILVKQDLSCVICDLGFATQISGSKYFFNGEEQHAETKSITDVGTLRYMCPEVLEGAVNLRDCETSLKQIDVYALGLVLWELATRCSDFFPNGIECGAYRLPFEAEIGHPTLEQMQVLVCRHKARPLFPDLWRETAAVRTVRETIEDCWDHDAEARLTALCVQERFHELSGFTERQKGVLYSTGISPIGRGIALIQKESHNVFALIDEKDGKENSGGGGDSCQSEGTMDTLVAITPQINCKNSNQMFGFCPSLQPYQGRNPCMERNLMIPHDGDSGSGELIDKSHKHVVNIPMQAPLASEYLNVPAAPVPQPPARPSVPIPFLQNVNSEPTQPKMSNVVAGAGRKSTWRRIREVLSGSRGQADETLISNELAVNVSTPIEEKLPTKVDLSNGKPEIKIAERPSELGIQNNRRPNTLPLSSSTTVVNDTSSSEKVVLRRDGAAESEGSKPPQLKSLATRVKTPGDVPLTVRRARGQKNIARFSLYDDRMMSGCYDEDGESDGQQQQSRTSLHFSYDI